MTEDADYDYPVGKARPLFSWTGDKAFAQPLPHLVPKSNTQKPQTVSDKLYHSLDRRTGTQSSHRQAQLSPFSSYSFFVPLNSVENYSKKESSDFQTFDKHPQLNMGLLDAVPPPPKSDTSPGNLYYSIPRNVPVDKRLANSFYINQSLISANTCKNPSSSHLYGPEQHFVPRPFSGIQVPQLQHHSRPVVPPKSIAVLTRMQNPGTPTSPNGGNIQKFPTLGRHDTAKTLPPLPVKRSNSTSSARTSPISPNYSYPPVNPRPVVVGVHYHSDKTPPASLNPSASSSSITSQRQEKAANIPNKTVQCQPNSLLNQTVKVAPKPYIPNNYDDDDDDGEDYAYDYVCLESGKKLNSDDENIKNLLTSVNIQEKYEQLALDSSDLVKEEIETLQKTFKNLNLNKRPMVNHFLSAYRRFFAEATRHFLSWNSLTVQLIRSPHPPDVCINFTKHILLSGQNILMIVKSFQRHCPEYNSSEEFVNEFVEALRKIVVQTKRFAGEYPSTILREDLEKAIDEVKGLINRFEFTL